MSEGTRLPLVEMSPEAIARRLDELGQLHRLALSLKGARRLGPVSNEATDSPASEDAARTR